jgi:hypothetical protein
MQLHDKTLSRSTTTSFARARNAVVRPVLTSVRQPTTTSSLQQRTATCSIQGRKAALQTTAGQQRSRTVVYSAAGANVSVQQSLLGEHLLLRATLHLAGWLRVIYHTCTASSEACSQCCSVLQLVHIIVCNSVGFTASVLYTFACTVSMHVKLGALPCSGISHVEDSCHTASACLASSLKHVH